MTPARARAVLAQVEAGPAHNWAAECLSEGQGEVGDRVVRLLTQGEARRGEVIALLRGVIAMEDAAA